MWRTLLTVVLLLVTATAAHAQENAHWPEQASSSPYMQSVDIITLNQPGVRHHCRVHSVTQTTMVCGVGFGRKALVYRRDDVAAIIAPPVHASRDSVIVQYMVGAACLAGSFFAPGVLPIILRVVAGFTPLNAMLTVEIGDIDHDHDVLQYQRAGTPLSVMLR